MSSTTREKRSDRVDEPSPPESTPWFLSSVEEVAGKLASHTDQGLSDGEAVRRQREHGRNELDVIEGRSVWSIFVAQFQSIIVVLLVVATVVSLALGDYIEAVAILVVIVINAIIGFLTEWRAERALAALRGQAVATAHVIRDGEERQIPAAELVPGDVVVLAAGGQVPADGRIIESVRLQVQESALTGESHAVSKATDALSDPETPLADRTNMAFLGTILTDGRGKLMVTATGKHTEMGHVGSLIEGAIQEDTPLEQKLHQLGRWLVGIVLVLCAIIVAVGWFRGSSDFWHMLEVGISLAIAAVPEGLPAVATMTLALGMQRMARMKALVRRLPAVETLGSTTVICTDKTGTLTRNEMTVCTLQIGNGRFEVSGTGFEKEGKFRREDGTTIDPSQDENLLLALRIGVLCNDARLDFSGEHPVVLGDPTEAALLVAAAKAGLDRDRLLEEFPRVHEIPFDSKTQRMVTVHDGPEGKRVAYIKGAPGTVLEASRQTRRDGQLQALSDSDRQQIIRVNEELAGRAQRVLAVAYRESADTDDEQQLTTDLIFVGLIGMIDPLREEAKDAIAVCREAGIRAMMITGDQPATAAEIARQMGFDRDRNGRPLRTVHGRELQNLDDNGWKKIAAETAVFARVSPEHKLRIVEALQSLGEIVAMTGDGVNDAPALKKADIGVAMGIKGTEVAKETADMVLLDDNFATMVAAVKQGRIIFANISRFIHYLFSCNLSEILVVFIAILAGWPLPLGALQVLWLNLITDVFPAMALALEPSAPEVMTSPPRNPKEPLVTWPFLYLVTWQGLLLSGVTLLAFWIGMRWYGREGEGLRVAVTMAFSTIGLAQVMHTFNARSRRRTALSARLFTNRWLWAAVAACILLQIAAIYLKPLRAVLRTVPLSAADWLVVAGCSLAPVVVVELVKLVKRSKTE